MEKVFYTVLVLVVPSYQKPDRIIVKHLLTQLSKKKPLIPLWGLDLLSVSPFPLYCWIVKQSSWPTLPDMVTAGLNGAAGASRREVQMLQFPLPCGNRLQFSDCLGVSEDLQAWRNLECCSSPTEGVHIQKIVPLASLPNSESFLKRAIWEIL